LYLDAVFEYADMLLATEQYAELASLINAAILIEPYDDRLHALLITALLRQGNSLAALNHYDVATDLLYRNFGVRPSEELRALYQEIMKERKSLEMDLAVIQNDLQETAARPGAFVCDYGVFREAYRLEARRAGREGSCVHVALITVSLPDGKTPSLRPLNATMDQLLEAIRFNLRRGDVVTRYSGAQYVLLLPTANYEDSQMVMERIVNGFYQQNRKNFLKISYKLQQMDLAE
jgi:tetratricopeptide (TPR) repeat protein